ncbi:integration host factor subunit alpha [bacterium]|nr:integration host factor subunit alpha [candidate division CSSED10-310 bacterium]
MSDTLAKADLISAIQTKNGYSLKKTNEIVETLLEIVKSAPEAGDDVLISGFGKFQVRDKRERRGRNPATGEDLIFEPRRLVTFKCSEKLKSLINRR